jgi:multiple sugar transport system substrate-binding protein
MAIRIKRGAWPRAAIAALIVVVACPSYLAAEASAQTSAGALPYAGTTLNFIGEETTQTDILKQLLPEFTRETGIKVNIEEAPYDTVVQKEILDFSTHKASYDVESMPYEYLGSYAEHDYIQPIDSYLNSPTWTPASFDKNDIIEKLWMDASNWKRKFYGFPSESPVMMMFYRQDLFSDPAEKKAFMAEYHYSLAPAETLQQYRDIAQFFTRKQGQMLAGKMLTHNFYGVATAAKRHIATFCEWMNYAWDYGGGIFDKQGNLINNSVANKEALTYWVGLTKYAPPGYTTYTWDEVTSAFQQGIVAEAITWGDTAPAVEDPSQSKVAGEMGFANIPKASASGPLVAHYGGWSYVINRDSTNRNAAYLFMRWALSRNVQLQLAEMGGLPARTSTFEDKALNAKFPYWKQELSSLRISTPRPRISQFGAIASDLELGLSKALAREEPPTTALDNVQKAMEQTMKGALPVTYQ